MAYNYFAMGLNLYRRHAEACKFSKMEGPQRYASCTCPIWCYGYLEGKRTRKSVGLRDWSRAVKRVERWEEKPAEALKRGSLSVANCVQVYMDDCAARNLARGTIVGYRDALQRFARYCAAHGVSDIHAVDVETFSGFRSSIRCAPATTIKFAQILRAFCAFAVSRKWMTENFAKLLRSPKQNAAPTLPFEPEEIQAILSACDRLGSHFKDNAAGVRGRLRAKALVYLLLYSGFRISDAVKLERKNLDMETGRLLVRVMKTRNPLYIKIHADALAALKALPKENPRYFFWTGESHLETAKVSASRTIRRLMKLAKVANGHAHRFRDTFAVELLKKGEDIRTVQLLLGHQSVRTTEVHYAPFVEAFQARLDAAVSKLSF